MHWAFDAPNWCNASLTNGMLGLSLTNREFRYLKSVTMRGGPLFLGINITGLFQALIPGFRIPNKQPFFISWSNKSFCSSLHPYGLIWKGFLSCKSNVTTISGHSPISSRIEKTSANSTQSSRHCLFPSSSRIESSKFNLSSKICLLVIDFRLSE